MIEQKYCVFKPLVPNSQTKEIAQVKICSFWKKKHQYYTPLRNSLASYFFELYAVRVKYLLVEEATT